MRDVGWLSFNKSISIYSWKFSPWIFQEFCNPTLNWTYNFVDSIIFKPCWGPALKLNTEYCQVTLIDVIITPLPVWRQQKTSTTPRFALFRQQHTNVQVCTHTHTHTNIRNTAEKQNLLCSVNPAQQVRRKFNSIYLFIPVTFYPHRYTGAAHMTWWLVQLAGSQPSDLHQYEDCEDVLVTVPVTSTWLCCQVISSANYRHHIMKATANYGFSAGKANLSNDTYSKSVSPGRGILSLLLFLRLLPSLSL